MDGGRGSSSVISIKGNSHLVRVLVTTFFLGGSMLVNTDIHSSQADFGLIVGVSQQAVSDLLARGVLSKGGTVGGWILEYTGHLRVAASVRAAVGDLDLATERARLAKEQADRIGMENAATRAALAPVALMNDVLSKVGARIDEIFSNIVPGIRSRQSCLSEPEFQLISSEVDKARRLVSSMSLRDMEECVESDLNAKNVSGAEPET